MVCGAPINGSIVRPWGAMNPASGGAVTTSTEEPSDVSRMYLDSGVVGCRRDLRRRCSSRSGEQMADSAALGLHLLATVTLESRGNCVDQRDLETAMTT